MVIDLSKKKNVQKMTKKCLFSRLLESARVHKSFQESFEKPVRIYKYLQKVFC
jgi:hypothetical protein